MVDISVQKPFISTINRVEVWAGAIRGLITTKNRFDDPGGPSGEQRAAFQR
jgi:hypothetical protein